MIEETLNLGDYKIITLNSYLEMLTIPATSMVSEDMILVFKKNTHNSLETTYLSVDSHIKRIVRFHKREASRSYSIVSMYIQIIWKLTSFREADSQEKLKMIVSSYNFY